MILYDARWSGPHGIGRFSREIEKRLVGLQHVPGSLPLLHPMEPLWLSGFSIKTRKKFRAYFSPGFNPPLWAPMPVIFTIHDLIHLRFEGESSATKKLYYETVVRPNVRRAAKVLTVSEFSKQEIMEWAGVDDLQVQVVGNGVGPEFTPDGIRYEPGYPYLLYVGNRKPHKNIFRMLQALARSQAAKDVCLLMSGDWDKETLNFCRSLHLQDKVAFAGRISDEELSAYYRGAMGLLFPSLYEGFGLPPLEAMACGCPVIASGMTSLPEVCGEAVLYCDPFDVDSIAEKIDILLTSDDTRRNLGAKGLERAKRFTWDACAAKASSIIEQATTL